MNTKYEQVEIDIIVFKGDDVVTASCPGVTPDPENCNWFVIQ